MGHTNKKQIGFYADKDVENKLKTINSGLKSKYINSAIRYFMGQFFTAEWLEQEAAYEKARAESIRLHGGVYKKLADR